MFGLAHSHWPPLQEPPIQKRTSAGFLYERLVERVGADEIDSFRSEQTSRNTDFASFKISEGLAHALNEACEMRDRTRGPDQSLALRHILFALSVTKGPTRSEVGSALSNLGPLIVRYPRPHRRRTSHASR